MPTSLTPPSQTPVQPPLWDRVNGLGPVAELAATAARAGIAAYLVGGTVRDLLLGREPLDVDLAVDAEPAALAPLLGGGTPQQTRFQTFETLVGETRVDVARTRSESYPRPGALPEVMPAGIELDLWRRDFSVNAFAIGLSGPHTRAMLAPPGALEDLAARRLSVLHERSFSDDPTRLLRLARYAARLGFEPDAHTRKLAEEAIAGGALQTLSGPRIGSELRLLAAEDEPLAAFAAAAELRLPWTLDRERTTEALALLPADGRADRLVLAAVFERQISPGGSPSELAATLDRLGFNAHDRDAVAQAAGRATSLARRLERARSGAEIAAAVDGAQSEAVALAGAHAGREQARTWLEDLRHRALEITGADLLAAGIAEGPALGAGLAAARAALLDGVAQTRQQQLELALRVARGER